MKATLYAAVLFTGIALGHLLFAPPHCPQEDSCYPDYQNGAWTIIQGERP